MGTAEDVNKVQKNISNLYNRKRAALFILSLDFAGRIINDFRQNQEGQTYWNNQSNDAMRTMFSDAFQDNDEVGFFLSHFEQYGIYLELANDRQNEAIRPLILKWAPRFFKDARSII